MNWQRLFLLLSLEEGESRNCQRERQWVLVCNERDEETELTDLCGYRLDVHAVDTVFDEV